MLYVWELILAAVQWLLSQPWGETIVYLVAKGYVIAVNVFFLGAVCLMLGVSWRIIHPRR